MWSILVSCDVAFLFSCVLWSLPKWCSCLHVLRLMSASVFRAYSFFNFLCPAPITRLFYLSGILEMAALHAQPALLLPIPSIQMNKYVGFCFKVLSVAFQTYHLTIKSVPPPLLRWWEVRMFLYLQSEFLLYYAPFALPPALLGAMSFVIWEVLL